MKRTILAILLLTAPVYAHITRIVIEHRETSGMYEKLKGHAYGELDPKGPLNAIITDLQFAPRNARGMVEYVSTFSMQKPLDLTKASGVLAYFVPNRGTISLDNGAITGDFRQRGHVLLASGWQGDLTPRDGLETITVPIAKNPDGSSITGPVVTRFTDMAANTNTLGLRQPAILDSSKATLTRRASENGKVLPIRSSEWAFADCAKTPFPGTPDPGKICLKGGFDAAFLYELSYTARDPQVLGIGFAATRDLISFFRYSAKDDTGAANLLAGRITHGIGQGNSQSGNFLRTMVHLGFNQDEAGRIVWDGINPNIAVRQLAMNLRFAAPGGAAGMYEPGSDGVVWWGDYTDEARGRPAGGLLDRCRTTDTCPKIVETFGASEFYGLRASPDLVGTKADRDIPLPSNVRRYYSPGVSHGGGRGGFDAAAPRPPAACELPANPNSSAETSRAVVGALVDWVVKGAAPPPSQYPRLDRGELVVPTQAAMGFPLVPGMPLPDGLLIQLYDYDFGTHFNYSDMSGVIGPRPPTVRQTLPSLVPRVDADGNEVAGVASVLHQAPLGTYLGWNVTARGFAKGTVCGMTGGFIAFANTKAEREASGDPRLSLEERYGTHAKYVAMVRAAADRLVRERFLLQEDADRLIADAEASSVLKNK